MPYSAEISRANPALLVFLLDQSGSMTDPFGGGTTGIRKADMLADVTNRVLHDLVIRCTKTEEIRDYFYVSIVGYGLKDDGVNPAFIGPLQGKALAKISEVGEYPARLENRTKKVPDGAGGLVDQTVRFPIWIEPKAEGKTPMCAALNYVHGIVQQWTWDHSFGFPPIILHITDGESTDGDPTGIAGNISALGTSDGSALLFNCHLSSQQTGKAEFPANDSSLPNEFAKTLYNMSSAMPSQFRDTATRLGLNVVDGARGFIFNGGAESLVHFFDIGTRPANLR